MEAALEEMQCRIAADAETYRAFVAQRREYFNSNPDRAGVVMEAIGPVEFARITGA